ncbi:MAG: Tol-Pal system beta propeller repeat protein TolB [Paracoccaceae bacterium]|nr:Tol-Pal system beta propeller repeat protein TolB [Paracoccaceae bacterium]
MKRIISLTIVLLLATRLGAEPLRITITDGVIEPLPFAAPPFVAETSGGQQYAEKISQLVAQDLSGTGLFREIPRQAHISNITSFASPVQFSDWKAINAQALVIGAVSTSLNGNVTVKVRIFDVFAGQTLGDEAGYKLVGKVAGWRKIGHKVSDIIYSHLTGESGYFDSRIVFVSEGGRKGARKKRLAIMDYDGANLRYLTDSSSSSSIVIAPRFSPTGDRVLFTSYKTGFPQIYLLDVGSRRSRPIQNSQGTMTFSPRFSPDGNSVVYSREQGGNSDIYLFSLKTERNRRLTRSPAIDTAPSFSPDGSQIVFESDRSGNQQLYVMSASGGAPKRISFKQGRYGTPVWSPRGDMIAFTKQNRGRFHIGVMRVDGREERLLTASFLDEGPTWSPNGRVIAFTRETQGTNGTSHLYSVDVSGRNLRAIPTPDGASDAAWSPLNP